MTTNYKGEGMEKIKYKLSRKWNFFILNMAIRCIWIAWDITKRNKDLKNDALEKVVFYRDVIGTD